MLRGYFTKLAINNLKNNGRLYTPFIGMNVVIIGMFYMLYAISDSGGLGSMAGGQSLRLILNFGVVIIGIFSVIALLYTNSFLMKRRQKEIGMFNVLGMGKRHLARVIGIETLMIAALCIFIGLVFGVVFSRLMYMVLLKLLSFPMTMTFELSLKGLFYTALVFGFIFALMLLINLKNIHLSNPIDLIKGSNVGEREPKSKSLLALIAVLTLGYGYYLALSVTSPLSAMGTFFLAVVLVMIGTYALFTAGSIVVLKQLRKNKAFYYKIEHFTWISGMIYRMKRNAAGIANICILSTMVVVSLSTTFSMYMGMEDLADNRYPVEVSIRLNEGTEEALEAVQAVIEDAQHEKKMNVKDYTQMKYTTLFTEKQTGTDVYLLADVFYQQSTHLLQLISQDTYTHLSGDVVSLSEDEVIVFLVSGNNQGSVVRFDGHTFHVVKEVEAIGPIKKDATSFVPMTYLIMKDDQVIKQLLTDLNGEPFEGFNYRISFDLEGTSEERKAFSRYAFDKMSMLDMDFFYDSKALSIESFLATYGGMFFIGIFLGTLFLLATVMIMYYKQILEGYEDKMRFEIMQKVGMNHHEIKKSIKAQTVGVFFMPLVLMMVHIAFAFNVVSKLLALFNFYNTGLFIMCTVATVFVFGVFYYMMYLITARVYFKIVKW